jgi:stage III sporulation protein AD
MALFWKAAGGILIALLLGLSIHKQDFALLLSVTVCAMVTGIVLMYLEPVLEFLRELEQWGSLRNDVLGVLLKALGIALTAELAGSVCSDAGNSALAKSIQLLGNMTILYVSLPVFRVMLQLIRQILGEI